LIKILTEQTVMDEL